MKNTPAYIEGITDMDQKKRYLKQENKALRDQLKIMSDNVNTLIEKMNHEAIRKRKYLGPNIGADSMSMASSPSRDPSVRFKAAE